MPCIKMVTNQSLDRQKEAQLKARFGKAIELLPRKSEKWLMCIFDPDTSMWFQGEDKPAVYLEVSVFGVLDAEPAAALTKELMDIVSGELAVPADCIYIKYSATPLWGWNGKNF